MRIVLALERVPVSAAAVQPALDLARALGAPVAALFVEDPALLAVAALPFARELDLASGAAQPLSAAGLELALQREARHAERMLAEAARRGSVAFTFRVVRDRLASAARAEAEAGDLVLLGLFARRGHADAHASGPAPVVAYCAAHMAPARVLATAARLSQAIHRPLAVATPPGERDRMQSLAGEAAVQPGTQWLPDAEAPSFLRAAAGRRAGLCVVAAAHAAEMQLEMHIRAGIDSALLVLVE